MKTEIDPIPESDSNEIDHLKSRDPPHQTEWKPLYLHTNAVRRRESCYPSWMSKNNRPRPTGSKRTT